MVENKNSPKEKVQQEELVARQMTGQPRLSWSVMGLQSQVSRIRFGGGAEAKTKVKGIEKLLNGMRQRCRNSSDMNEVEQLQKDASTCCSSC